MANNSVTFPNLLSTWIEYREAVHGQSKADVINHINRCLSTNLNHSVLYQYRSGLKSCPDQILNIIDEEFVDMIAWLLSKLDVSLSTEQLLSLSDSLRPSIKKSSG